MGYYSNVKIAVKYDEFKPLIADIDKRVELYNSTLEENNESTENKSKKLYKANNIIRDCDSLTTDNESYYIISFEYRKMYSGNIDVDILYKALDYICEDNYNFFEVGEDGEVLEDIISDLDLPQFYTSSEILVEGNEEEIDVDIRSI